MTDPPSPELLRLQRWILALASLAAGLAVVVVLQLARGPGPGTAGPSQAPAGGEPDKAALMDSMISNASGIFDAFPDAEVGRVLLPHLEDRANEQTIVSSNRFGMREREYEVPKPADLVRVVFIGDSYVFGWLLGVEQRASAVLERELQARCRAGAPRIEVLSLGITSWNLAASTAYMRRQLDVLAPDIVVQVTVPNDVNDNWAVRGFGGIATIALPHRERADAPLFDGHGASVFGASFTGLLSYGLDYEGRTRYAENAAGVAELAQAVKAMGGHYFLMVDFGLLLPQAGPQLVTGLPRESVIWLPIEFYSDAQYTLSRTDPHWSVAGHEVVARLVYGRIQRQGLLPQLGLPPWDEAERAVRDLDEVGAQQSAWQVDIQQLLGLRKLVSELDFASGNVSAGYQVHGGIDRQGRLSPFASLLLLNQGAHTLHVEGAALDRGLRAGSRLRISLEGIEAARVVLERGQPFDLRLDLPPEVRDRPMINVRFEVDDYVYAPEDLRHCISAQLDRVALEP